LKLGIDRAVCLYVLAESEAHRAHVALFRRLQRELPWPYQARRHPHGGLECRRLMSANGRCCR
jgi:hypothetical protein